MTEPPHRYGVTITVIGTMATLRTRPSPPAAAEQAASARPASIVSAHAASQIVSIVTVLTADRLAAVAVALAVVSDALRRRLVSLTR
jgi:hypothetical protein